MNETLQALHESADRLDSIVSALAPEQLAAQAYPSKWTIADVLSHIGSGAVIMRRTVAAAAGEGPAPDGFNQSVWDEWNAKSPTAKAADALVADRALLDAVNRLSDEQRAAFTASFGPMTADLAMFLGLRLNEHAVHTWDIEVVGDPAATIPPGAASVIVDSLALITSFAGKPAGAPRTVTVHTADLKRDFEVAIGTDSVTLAPTSPQDGSAVDLTLPAEALVRLIYGRLDPAHCPPVAEAAVVDGLRQVFPGF